MSTAFPNPSGALLSISPELIAKGLRASRNNDRKRMIYPLHRVQEAPVQRMLNFLQPGTYIRPHKHPREGATESMLVMQGEIDFFMMDNNGQIERSITVSDNGSIKLIDIEDNVWHSFIVRKPDTILFEVKMGPYDVDQDKTFAPWAPGEGDATVRGYMEELERQLEARK